MNERDHREYTPLHHAAEHGAPNVVRALLETGADVNARATGFQTDYGWSWTPLHLAAEHNPEPGVVAALLEAGADLDPPTREGRTPLHQAAANPNPAVTAVLLQAGADVNTLSWAGETPLHVAARMNPNPAVLNLLLEAGADVNARGLGRGGDERFGVLTACGRHTGNRGRGSAWRRGWQAGHPAIPPVRRTRRRTG